MVLDVVAKPSGRRLEAGTSVQGTVVQRPGGVARNICEALGWLIGPERVKLISVVGQDPAASVLLQHWRSLNHAAETIRVSTASTPTVSAVLDLDGELLACVADTAAVETDLSATWVRGCLRLSTADAPALVLLDANMAADELEVVAQECSLHGVPVFFEPVSVPKSVRAARILQCLDYIKPNRAEVAEIAASVRQLHRVGACAVRLVSSSQQTSAGPGRGATGADGTPPLKEKSVLEEVAGAMPHIATVLAAGVRCIILSMGQQGCAVCTLTARLGNGNTVTPGALRARVAGHGAGSAGQGADGDGLRLTQQRARPGAPGDRLPRQAAGRLPAFDGVLCVAVSHVPALPCKLVSVNGAGDCLVAGTLFGLSQGRDAVSAVLCGVAAAKVACESAHNVPPSLNGDELLHSMSCALHSVRSAAFSCDFGCAGQA